MTDEFHIDPEESYVLREPERPYNDAPSARVAHMQAMRVRTKAAAIAVINFLESERASLALREVSRQLIRSATSTAANYRAACLSRSGREFYAKMCIVVEEADETIFWLAILYESDLKVDKESLIPLGKEWREISKIMSKARSTYRKKKKS